MASNDQWNQQTAWENRITRFVSTLVVGFLLGGLVMLIDAAWPFGGFLALRDLKGQDFWKRWWLLELGGVLAVAFVRFAARTIYKASDLGKESEPLNAPEEVKRVIAQLRRRAIRLRVTANVTILLIVLTLLIGSLLFINAGELAGKEVGAIRTTSRGLPDTTLAGAANDRTIYLISSLTTRFGAVLILLFLVQTLITLYRYNTRLAAFFDSRADVLELLREATSDKLATLVQLFAPEAIDYGRLPRTPSEQLLAIAKEGITRPRPGHAE